MKKGYIYILASNTGTLYIGVTSNLGQRIWQHKSDLFEGFSKKYGCHKLIYFEEYDDISNAIAREKQIKAYRRGKKEDLIKILNPLWKDLSEGWNLSDN